MHPHVFCDVCKIEQVVLSAEELLDCDRGHVRLVSWIGNSLELHRRAVTASAVEALARHRHLDGVEVLLESLGAKGTVGVRFCGAGGAVMLRVE